MFLILFSFIFLYMSSTISVVSVVVVVVVVVVVEIIIIIIKYSNRFHEGSISSVTSASDEMFLQTPLVTFQSRTRRVV